MFQAMISRKQGMEMDMDQGTTGSEMVEILGKLKKKKKTKTIS